MPKKSIYPLREIEDEQIKRTTFKKRYNGIKIKLIELATMCNIDFALVVNTKNNGKRKFSEIYSSEDLLTTINGNISDCDTTVEIGMENLIEKYIIPHQEKKQRGQKKRQKIEKSNQVDNLLLSMFNNH